MEEQEQGSHNLSSMGDDHREVTFLRIEYCLAMRQFASYPQPHRYRDDGVEPSMPEVQCVESNVFTPESPLASIQSSPLGYSFDSLVKGLH